MFTAGSLGMWRHVSGRVVAGPHFFVDCLTLTMKKLPSFETSATTRSTQCHIPEDLTLQLSYVQLRCRFCNPNNLKVFRTRKELSSNKRYTWLRAARAGLRLVDAPGRLIIRRHFKPIFFKLFRPRTGLEKIFENAWPNCGLFSEKFFRVWNPKFTRTIHVY